MQSDAAPVALGVLFALAVVTVGVGVRHLFGRMLSHRFDARFYASDLTWRRRRAGSLRKRAGIIASRAAAVLTRRRLAFIAVPLVAGVAAAAVVAATLVSDSRGHGATAAQLSSSVSPGGSLTPVIRIARLPGGRVAVTKLGPWSMQDPSLRHAIAAFGRPSSHELRRGLHGCAVTWTGFGLTVVFAPSRSCDPSTAMKVATITARGHWRTWAGLRVGDPASAIRARHPHATAHRGVWWLPTSAVAAIVRAGHIYAFRLTLGR